MYFCQDFSVSCNFLYGGDSIMIVRFWKRGRQTIRRVTKAVMALAGYGIDYGNNYGG